MTNHEKLSSLDNERILVKGAQNGDQEAFGILYRENRKYVTTICARILRHHPGMVEDIVQEVFLLAWQKLGKFRGTCRFRTWIHRVAWNRAAYELRRKATRGFDLNVDDVAPLLGYRPDLGAGRKLDDAMNCLNNSERRNVGLLAQGYMACEVASMLGITSAAVRASRHRALVKMRRAAA